MKDVQIAKKLFLTIMMFFCVVAFSGCDGDNSGNAGRASYPPVQDIDAKVFFATDFHYMVNCPITFDVFVNDEFIGTLTKAFFRDQLDMIKQYDNDTLYPFILKYNVDKPQVIKYTLKSKNCSDNDLTGEINIDKSGDYYIDELFFIEVDNEK